MLFGWEDSISLTLDFLPVIGSCKGVAEFISGQDPITGEPIPRWIAVVGIIPFGKYFSKGGKVTYEIVDGMRRAKAAELTGKETIVANIFDKNEKLLDSKEIPIDSLLSPNKLTIDFFTDVDKDRFMEALDLAKSGSTPPPISVIQGCKGPKICDVTLDPYGD